MNRITVTLAVLLTLTLTPVFEAGAQSNTMTVQGVLRTAGGDVVNGVYDMMFRFYESEGSNNAVFTAGVNNVSADNGVYTAVINFGNSEPVQENSTLWLGVEVDGEDEYPRVQLGSVPYAISSASAKALDCSGCISEGMLGYDPVTEADLAAGDLVVNGTVQAAMFIGDGSGLTGISSPSGVCAEGWLVNGIDEDGTLLCAEAAQQVASVHGLTGGTINGDVEVGGTLTVNGAEVCTEDANCGDTLAQLACDVDDVAVWNGDMWTCGSFADLFDPALLPNDGINEVSNDLLFNQFEDVYASSSVPVEIPDNNPTGVDDEIVVPDAGIAQELTVSINITNSDFSTVKVILYDPENVEYVLYDKDGPGNQLGATYPTPQEPVSGDLTTWIGKNPMGTWRLEVSDTGFKDNGTDGNINAWSIQVLTLSSKKIQVKGDLIIDGGIMSAGGDGLAINEDGDAAFTGTVKVGTDDGPCDESKEGALRYDETGGIQLCEGGVWVSFRRTICPGFLVDGVCVASVDAGNLNFRDGAKYCAKDKADICTDSQSWVLRRTNMLDSNANWTNSFADNDSGQWSECNGGTGDDHGWSSGWQVPCCHNLTPPRPTDQNIDGVRLVYVHNTSNVYFRQAARYCTAMQADLCDKAQYQVLRNNGIVSVGVWASDHSDNDSGYANSAVATSDNTNLGQHYGFACCANHRTDLTCPGDEYQGVCVTKVVNSGQNWNTAATDCAAQNSRICSIAQSSILREAGVITASANWTASFSDNDGGNASVGVGNAGDDHSASSSYGYACCW